MLTFAAILLAGLLGLAGHWYNRYAQGRTASTFVEYLSAYRSRTISSAISIVASEVALFQSAPPELNMQTLFTAFTFGYTIDSIMNMDKAPSSDEEPAPTLVDEHTDFPEGQTAKPKTQTSTPKKSLKEIIDETRDPT